MVYVTVSGSIGREDAYNQRVPFGAATKRSVWYVPTRCAPLSVVLFKADSTYTIIILRISCYPCMY